MAAPIPAIPPHYKQIQHYMKTAAEHDKRDAVVAYYCRLYALQKAMEIDRKSPESKKFLVGMMDYLEDFKKAHAENEAVTNEVVGQAHVEQYALKLFLYADNEDRGGRFGKNVVKSFYTAGLLMDVLTTFGELADDLVKNRKYAKWKAAYIHKCLQSGETPIAGPFGEEEDEFGLGPSDPSQSQPPGVGFEDHSAGAGGYSGGAGGYSGGAGGYSSGAGHSDAGNYSDPGYPSATGGYPSATGGYPPATGGYPPATGGYSPATGGYPSDARSPQASGGYSSGAGSSSTSSHPSTTGGKPFSYTQPTPPAGGVALKAQDYQRAMKLCKHASSALQYEDGPTAIDLLSKALNLLVTGKE